jgi:hypothetical protein
MTGSRWRALGGALASCWAVRLDVGAARALAGDLGDRALRTVPLLVPLMVALVLAVAVAPSAASAKAGGCRGTRAIVGGRQVCVRVGQRCQRARRSAYLLVGLDCVRRRGRYVLVRASLAAVRAGRVLALPRSGRPTFQQALWWFDTAVAPLPGVHVPRGAVGTDRSGTAAIKALSRYSKLLTARQRAVLRAVLRPHGAVTIDPNAPTVARATAAVAAAALGDLPAILAESLRRLKAHGILFRHNVSLAALSATSGTDQAQAIATWLEGTGTVCAISFRPSGLHASLLERRTVMLHELMHCAAAEQCPSRAAWDNQPAYLDEGLAEWAADRVSIEWQGRLANSEWWPVYLGQPAIDVRTRSYDAVGLWSLFEHEGVDLFKLHPALIHAGGSGDPDRPLAVALASTPDADTTIADWGSTLATAPALGTRWNLDGPGMPRRSEPTRAVDDGDLWTQDVAAASAYETKLDLRADVVRIRTTSGTHGLLRDSVGIEHELGSDDRYCVREGGCTCPDGRNLTVADIPAGDSRLGYADAGSRPEVILQGETLDQVCKPRLPSGIEVHREIDSHDQLVARFVSGKCQIKKKVFTATATNGGYTLTVRISAFGGYRRQYPLSYGIADPGFVLTGPGGPWATANRPPIPLAIPSAIVFDKSGTRMSLSFPAVDASGTGGALLAGIMTCKKT